MGNLDSIIYRMKDCIPSPLWRKLTAPYWWWYNRASHQLAAFVSRRRRKSVARIKLFQNKHQSERCFILGNGPSLKHTDLSRLKNEITFGMNRIYLLFPQIGFPTSYYLAINTLVIEQCANEIMALDMPRFVSWRGRKWLRPDPDVIYLDTDYTDPPTFSRDLSGRVFEGSTVTYVAMQLAYHMGFEEVILVGVDHSFTTKGKPNVTVVSDGEDPNHFSTEYFGKGYRWQLPDLEASERAYLMAREAFETSNRRILDATIGGKLDIFPKIQLEDLF